MRMMSLYKDKDTIIHKIDPLNKILYILASILITMLISDFKILTLTLVFSFLLLAIGKVIKNVFPIISFSLIVLVTIVIIQGLFNPSNKIPLFNIGQFVFYKEGIIYSFLLILRVLNILCAFSLLILTTKPSDLIENLVRRGLSPKLGYVLASVLQIIPQMLSTMDTILDAQRSRGLETEGKLIKRLKAFIPLIGPAVMNSLISTRERAMALEMRGFNSNIKKTFLNEHNETSMDKLIRYLIIALIIFTIVWRLVWLK
ncbi:energy-coupling factor transporter transmembrane component T [Caloramator sp. CAR-1]|uniref:energy-coupling factor transporter transmembrane component T family protein n=1 Tax=Caloramator sp. CAR-1 TaxID=3062777 RepID=UPI0026E1D3AA|nr:energy-coupling factor transporter transmembrane component T [Caloramator sp. CAR-1]MDO6354854.1 energy-coupling factor transporter transmembrane component T [Caloramator sp. CAR-1]